MSGAKKPLASWDEAAARAEPPSLDELYRRHAVWLRGRLRARLGPRSSDRVDDLVQETYLRAAALDLSGVRHPRAFLLQVASRLAIDGLRMTRREAMLPPPVLREDPGQDAQVLLKEVVLKLPPQLRDVFLLSRLDGLSYAEIGRLKGVSVKTVEARMSRALAFCASRLRT